MGGLRRRLTHELTGRIPRNGDTTIYDLTYRALASFVQGNPVQANAYFAFGDTDIARVAVGHRMTFGKHRGPDNLRTINKYIIDK